MKAIAMTAKKAPKMLVMVSRGISSAVSIIAMVWRNQ
jgi:adenylyl- and sulfurtransferase ThiI